MAKKGVIFTVPEAARAKAAIEHYERDPRHAKRPIPTRPHVTHSEPTEFRFGVLDGDLTSPATVTDTPTTVTVSKYSYSAGLISDLDENFTLTNFDPALTAETGAFVIATEIVSGVWVPVWLSCPAQNCKMQILVGGAPTGGTFDLITTIDGTEETLTFDFDFTASEVAGEFETHSEVASGDVVGTGGPLPNAAVEIEFTNNLAGQNIALPLPSYGSLSGGAGRIVIVSYSQFGV